MTPADYWSISVLALVAGIWLGGALETLYQRRLRRRAPAAVANHLLIRDLINGIERWAREEDGVPDWLEPAYLKGRELIGRRAP